MKNFTISLEGLLLIVLLIVGLYGAKSVLQGEDAASPELASPRQESPAMVYTPELANDPYQ